MLAALEARRSARREDVLGIWNAYLNFMQKWNKAGNRRVRQAGSARGVAMSYDAFVQTRPNAEWLALTNCQLNLFQASYLHHPGDTAPHPYQYYIPVHGMGSPSGKICILLKTSEPDMMATISEIRGLKTDSALLAWTSKNSARAFPKRTVQGVILSGLEDLKSTERSELKRVQTNIADDFIILDSNAEPSLTAGISYSAAGLAALFGMAVYARRKSGD
jgi:hypothetical protein